MFRLAHFSDPHLGPLPDPSLLQLLSKRVLGYVNWRRNRLRAMGGDYLARLLDDMEQRTPDHIALTGDLVNIALPSEIAAASAWLGAVAAPERLSVVPGNHDAYVPGALRSAMEAWSAFMTGDGTPMAHPGTAHFPYVRRRGPLALVGVSTARATAPGFATGRVGVRQTRRLTEVLAGLGEEGLFRVVLIHHPPFQGATSWYKRLEDASRVRAAIKRAGAELVLHGHTHVDSRTSIEGPDGPVPVIGVPSASHAPGGRKPAARYNLFTITAAGDAGWTCSLEERGFRTIDGGIEEIDRADLTIPRRRR
ncbi:metallophosphoesterase [Microvirga tunisiensis]|uniref:Metallophosphoesterase n=2 Tax=Pannonibacter tanglangensis TaxID=2750084 RepID=A0A7X5J7W6_9HYPH|nr:MULTISPECIES: metallophosphoesterase [unclassified Pannonibacter]NBN63223.1 metallophosphoesterase [Pannonibacter sp. XCT-34]NBN76861.1 metallophosphoesterase [Pannonibacter sp. XCT-53]